MNTFLLRLAVAIILLAHSIPGMIDGGVYGFGRGYLDQAGFAPLGLLLAWAIKLSHVACAICLLWGKWIKPAAFITIAILIAGIIMVHGREGWFVVGGGRNGSEFNFLLIVVLIVIMYPKGWQRRRN
ncbi:DoxX family protein [Taibaiella koreensis]|uniref:DoxX family protein n=1 Tax=Taibaiella koreensis TaxID=1268548 RepID=UPI000E59B9B7|nr:DoxX family protein [Taibaiella koreensis]